MGFLITLCIFVAWAYWMCNGPVAKSRSIAALLLAAFGVLAAYDGVTLAWHERARAQDGRVLPGVVVSKTDSTERERSRRSRRLRRYRNLVTEGFTIHDVVGRIILTGSPTARMIEYRYACESSQGCRDSDFVSEALWRRLHVGDAVNVRQARSETNSSRLDENSRWAAAMVDLIIGGLLLLVAAVVSGRLTASRPRYVTVPAVVTAVEDDRAR